jgi:hypothetical protein
MENKILNWLAHVDAGLLLYFNFSVFTPSLVFFVFCTLLNNTASSAAPQIFRGGRMVGIEPRTAAQLAMKFTAAIATGLHPSTQDYRTVHLRHILIKGYSHDFLNCT